MLTVSTEIGTAYFLSLMQNLAVVTPACRFLPAAWGAWAAWGRFPPTAGATPARRQGTFASPVDNFLRQPFGSS
jgi:hypothetical protein